MEVDLDNCYKLIVDRVRYVGKIIKDRASKEKSQVDEKSSDIDLVTETDQEVEKILMKAIKENFPSHKFIGEESVAGGAKCELTDAPTWVIDPVDGTMNFVHGYPNVCTSVGLLVNKVPEIGIVYNPILELFFEARRGCGAKLNGNPIHVSKTTVIEKCLLGIEFGTTRDPDKMRNVLDNINNLVPKVHGARSAGSAAQNMALVALGCSDAYFEFGIHAWDVAAGELLVREAGGVVMDPSGGEFDLLSRRVLCAGTPELAAAFTKELIQFYPERD